MRQTRTTQLWLITIAIAACCVVVCAAGPAFADTIYDTAVSYWNLDNDVLDHTGSNDGENHDATPTTGKVGGAYAFDGDNDYIEITGGGTDLLDGATAFTLAAWVYSDNPGDANGIIRQRNPDNWGINWKLGAIYFVTPGGQPTAELSTGSWQYYCATWKAISGTVDLYRNGVLANSSGAHQSPLEIDGYWYIGSDDTDLAGRSWLGMIDEVAIWNTALSPDDVETLYSMGLIGGGVINTLAFDQETYDTEALGDLADLYAAQTGSVTIDGIVWTYMSEVPGGHGLGDAWTDSGTHYIQLQSNSDGLTGSGVPEPATVVGMLAAMAVAGYRRIRKTVMSKK